ncbi:MAG: hypothetical protein ACE5D8_03645 [Fidelibacterota bacterium]
MTAGYDKHEINVRFIGCLLLGFLIVLGITLVFVDSYYTKATEAAIYSVNVPVSEKRIALDAKEEQMLNSYELIDAEKGIYRIPIDRAMALTAQNTR